MKKMINIICTNTPEVKDIDFLTQQINQETLEDGKAFLFAFFIKDPQDRIIAGANGSVVFGAIYTDQLWVHPSYRKQGIGGKLINQIHEYGREKKCTMATVATMNFQNAQKFYQHLGYRPDFERAGYIKNSSCIFLRKNL